MADGLDKEWREQMSHLYQIETIHNALTPTDVVRLSPSVQKFIDEHNEVSSMLSVHGVVGGGGYS